MLFRLILVLFLFSSLCIGKLKETDKAYLQNTNLLQNAGFESGLSKWLDITGSSSLTLESSSALFGTRSAKWDASATGEYWYSSSRTIPTGLKGAKCSLKFQYLWDSGTNGHLTFAINDGTDDKTSPIDLEQTEGVVRPAVVHFTCPSSGTIRMKLASTANAAEITIDNVHLGSMVDVSGVLQDSLYGGVVIATDPAHTYSNGTTTWTTATDPDVISGDKTHLKKAIITDTAGDFGAKFAKIEKGMYRVVVSGPMFCNSAGTEYCNFGISDGTNLKAITDTQATVNSQQQFISSIEGIFEYTDDEENIQFSLQARTRNAVGDARIYLNTGGEFSLYVYKLGGSSKDAVSVDSSVTALYAYHDTDCLWTQSTSGSFLLPTGDATCTFTSLINKGFGTVISQSDGTGNQSGITFTPKSEGLYWSCVTATLRNTVVDKTAYYTIYSNNTGSDVEFASVMVKQENADNEQSQAACGFFEITNLNPTNITMKMNTGTSSSTRVGTGARTIWNIIQISSSTKMVQFDNLVTSSSSDGTKIVSAAISNSGTPNVSDQDGGWIDEPLVDLGTGYTRIPITAGTFSTAPRCTCTVTSSAKRMCAFDIVPTTSNIQVVTTAYSSGTNEDKDFDIICVGKK